MQPRDRQGPWWASLTVWGVVNAVCVLQGVGFLSRIPTGSRALNHVLGYVIVALAVPAALALAAFVRARADRLQRIGPTVYLGFVAMMIGVEYIWRIEFRSPPVYGVLVPYLVLFFGSIFLMGLPMFRLDRRLWFVTAVSATFLLGAMMIAMLAGVG